jgi:membrane protein YqaA with SNARE-associated domain
MKTFYKKSIEWAAHKNSKAILAFISFIESFIFPLPPDLLIIPMTIAKMNDWFKIALIATIGSVLGACFGYFIGYIFFNEIGIPIFELYGIDNTSFLEEKISQGRGIIAWASFLAIAAFTPIPFKLLTITSGFLHFNLIFFILICFLVRGFRFFLISILIGKFGPKIKLLIEKKLIKISIIFTILTIGVAFILYFLLKKLMLI